MWTSAPAARSVVAMMWRPRDRSMKRGGGELGRFERELAADCFLDFKKAPTVVLCERLERFARLETLCNYRGRNARATQHGTAKRYERIDHDCPWLVWIPLPRERIELDRETLEVAFDPAKIRLHQIPHLDLASLAQVDQ